MAISNIKKNARGYGYTYTDLAAIHEQLEALGWTYYQYIETLNGDDYIYTVMIIDGKEQPPRRGCKIIETVVTGKDGKAKTNPAQSYGSGLTYARRYSLLMAAGFATTDDDAATLDGTVAKREAEERSKAEATKARNAAAKAKAAAATSATKSEHRMKHEQIILDLADELGININLQLKSWGKPDLNEISDSDLLKTLDWLEAKKNV